MTKQLAPVIGAVLAAALGIGSAAIAIRAHSQPPPTPYSVEVTVYVRDPQAMCKDAWDVALHRFGLDIAEAVTMTRGEFVAVKCLAVLYQTAAVGEQVVSAGIEVREVSR